MMHEINKCARCAPVGRKANWSEIRSEVIAGRSHLDTTNFSIIRDKIGVTDIGLKSDRVPGFGILGTDVITAVSH